MADTVEIGAARVHLIVDSDDYATAIGQARNVANAFGKEAAAAFDNASSAVHRATTRALDYVASIKSTDAPMERHLRNLARLGADESIIKSLAQAWKTANREIQQAADEQREMNRAMEEAQQINAEFGRQRAANAQQRFDADYGVVGPQRSVEYLEEQQRVVRALTLQAELREQHERRIAEALAAQHSEALQINSAFDQNRADMSQRRFNEDYAPGLVNSAKNSGATISALTAEFQQMDAAIDAAFAQNTDIDRFRQQLENLQKTAGKTHYEMLQMRADQLGVGATFRPLIDGIKKQDEAMGHAGLTAKQYQLAMRGLPAQLTDISVGLATGQTPWMVFLQQGGQLKDMFGGVVPAAKAVGTAVWGMVNPLTIGAAALAAIVTAAWQAEQRLANFAIATAKGGGFAGAAGDLQQMADAIDNVAYVTRSAADESVGKLASSVRLVGDDFKVAAETTARWVTLTGEQADSMSAKFDAIAKGPLEAIESGTVLVTREQYEYIKALVATGDQQKAVTELVRIFGDTTNSQLDEVERNIGAMHREWLNVKDVVSDATATIMGFGNQAVESLAAARNSVFKFFETMDQAGGSGKTASIIGRFFGQTALGPTGYQIQKALAERAKAAATPAPTVQMAGIYAEDYDAGEAKRIKARTTAMDAYLATADKAAQRKIQMNKLDEEGNALGLTQVQIAAVKARQQAEWDAQDARANRQGSTGRDATQAIRDQMAVEMAALSTQTRQVEIQYQLREISADEYYARLKSLAQQELDVTTRSNNAQIAALAGRKDEERQVHTLRAANLRAEEAFAQRTMDLDAQQTQAQRQRQFALSQYVNSLKDSTVAIERQTASQVAAVGMGQQELAQLNDRNQILQKQDDLIRDIAREVERDPTYDVESRKNAVLRETEIQLGRITDRYRQLDAARADWSNGANRAWEDFKTQAADTAGVMYTIWTDAFNGIGQGISDLVLEGKANFDDLIKSMLSQLIKLATNKLFVNMLGGMNGGAGPSFGSFFFADGGVPGGNGLSAYRNQIISSPIVFPFAKGGVPNVGVAGEAGTEGIFPMLRDSKGRLGVSAVGANTSPPNVNVTVYGAPAQPQVRSSQGSNGDLNIDLLFDGFDGRMAQGIVDGTSMTGVAIKNMQGR